MQERAPVRKKIAWDAQTALGEFERLNIEKLVLLMQQLSNYAKWILCICEINKSQKWAILESMIKLLKDYDSKNYDYNHSLFNKFYRNPL